MNETQAIAKFKKEYPIGKYYKLHGGRFQSTLPDIIWCREGFPPQFLEFKCVDGLTLGWAKCRLGQHLTMLEMAKNGAMVKYMVYSKKTDRFYCVPPLCVQEGEGLRIEDFQFFS